MPTSGKWSLAAFVVHSLIVISLAVTFHAIEGEESIGALGLLWMVDRPVCLLILIVSVPC